MKTGQKVICNLYYNIVVNPGYDINIAGLTGVVIKEKMNGELIVALDEKVNRGTRNITGPAACFDEPKEEADEMLDALFVGHEDSPYIIWDLYLHGVPHEVVNGRLLEFLALDHSGKWMEHQQPRKISQRMFDGLTGHEAGLRMIEDNKHCFEPGKRQRSTFGHF